MIHNKSLLDVITQHGKTHLVQIHRRPDISENSYAHIPRSMNARCKPQKPKASPAVRDKKQPGLERSSLSSHICHAQHKGLVASTASKRTDEQDSIYKPHRIFSRIYLLEQLTGFATKVRAVTNES
jgi:hypothetical protein